MLNIDFSDYENSPLFGSYYDNYNENGFSNDNTSLESDGPINYYLPFNEKSDSLHFLTRKRKKSGESGKHPKPSEGNKIKKGRKNKNSEETGKHTKHSEDNKIRKIKRLFRDDLLEFINDKIKNLDLNISNIDFEDKKCRGTKVELLKIRPKQTYITSVKYNQNLFNKTVKDFLSDKINSNYRMYPPEFNALLIKKIYQIDTTEKNVTSILDKTFLDCLKYYRKDNITDEKEKEKYKCLDGLQKKFEKLKSKLMKEGNEEEYVDDLIRLIKDLDNIYSNKKARESKKSSNNLIIKKDIIK